MSDRTRMQIGTIGGVLAAIFCCAAPLLIAGSLGIGGALASGSYQLIPFLAVALGWALWRLYRHRSGAEPCGQSQSLKEGVRQ